MSLLRALVDVEAFKASASQALLDAALRVRRAGLEHLVTEAAPAEVDALALAGEVLAAERAWLAARAAVAPEAVAALFGGSGGDDWRRATTKALLRAAADLVAQEQRDRARRAQGEAP